MLIHDVATELFSLKDMKTALAAYAKGEDVTISLGQSARNLLVAALWALKPRSILYVVPGEEQAERASRYLASWLGLDYVCRFPERRDLPWKDTAIDDAIVGERCKSLYKLAKGEPTVVVASAHALLRRVPPVGTAFYASMALSIGDEVSPEDCVDNLIAMGYSNAGSAKDVNHAGLFYLHGDSLDVFPAQATNPVRIEFFDTEIDRIRKMLPATGQTIGELEEVEISPSRELALTEETIKRARLALYDRAEKDSKVAADLELIEGQSDSPTLEKYLKELYGQTASPIDHIAESALVLLSEPRALFDDCMHYFDDISQLAKNAKEPIDELFSSPRNFDFGPQQRFQLSSMLRVGQNQAAEITVKQPNIAGGDTKLLARLRQLTADNCAVVFAVPDRSARDSLKLLLTDEGISFEERLSSSEDRRALAADSANLRKLKHGRVYFVDAALPAGVVLPEAKLAVLSIADLSVRMAKGKKKAKRIDVTQVSFPFKPGDYVVHANHGIAYFANIVRQEVAGRERDYFLLEYANKDKLFVPLEQVDRLTRYVGPDGSSPRLTRLNTADWSRATGKARKSAKKLAFDLVDLYTRRSSIIGFAFSSDSPAQEDMEASFSYDLTPDQASALLDIKADMEAAKPMDRLLCGDVGFGKTEVALRAAFKATQDGRQVMVLCPTTILAQQHFETFFSRFSPFGVKVKVLSRFVSGSQQKQALREFAEGELDVLVGTHRLLSADVNPSDLGLVIIDEEQRFGVQHKEQLKNLREQVDVLTLSATPIPRTMQMALSGVRDMSLILTPPPGRLPVKVSVGEWDPDVVSEAIRSELGRGGQVYYVSNRVTTIGDALERLQEAVPEARIAVAHGQMSAIQIEDVMLRFAEREVDVLLATTIIESGIDNPHTNTLIIEDSQRLGLAQLYQLKGRVGRGRSQAYAYFMFDPTMPLTEEATERLTAISEFQELGSGMRIAMRDLEIRGAGSLVGAEQHGNLSSVGFDLFTQMLQEAVSEARGEEKNLTQSEVTLNLPADFYLAEEYVPEVDKRVLAYRRIAAAESLHEVDAIQKDLEDSWGAMPLAARNLLDRARLRIRAERLGVSSISLTNGRLIYQGLNCDRKLALEIKSHRGVVYPKSSKVSYPFHTGKEELMPAALGLLELAGGSDEDELVSLNEEVSA